MPGEQVVTMSVSEPPNPRYTCPFLELSGELRNYIYDFAVENRMIMFTPRRNQGAQIESKTHDPVQSNVFNRIIDSSPSKGFPFTCQEADDERRRKRAIRQFRGLTQVCRLIRTEYLPRYRRMFAHRVCHVDLEDYVNMVLIPDCLRMAQQAVPLPTGDIVDTKAYYEAVLSQQLVARQHIARIVVVDCKSWEERAGLPGGRRGAASADILPFLKFCMTAPGIQAQCGYNACQCCEHDWAGQKDNLNRLFQVNKNPKLAAWLEVAVDEVTLNWPPSLNFLMKKGHGRGWMGNWTHMRIDSKEMRDWEDDVGLKRDDDAMETVRFTCFLSDWGLEYGRQDVSIEEIEENEFWGKCDKGNQERSKKPRQKVKWGKVKYENKKGRQRWGS